MQTFNCPHCHTKLFFEQIAPGAQVKCTACEKIIHAPAEAELSEVAFPPGLPSSGSAPAMKHVSLIAKLVVTYIVLIIVGGFVFGETPMRIRGYAGGNTFAMRLIRNSLGMDEDTAIAFDPSNPALVTFAAFVIVAGVFLLRTHGRKHDAV